ncbi:hypothetical protein BGW80DRAFT_1289588 [Lactifluus volemus]|nr:hypothetical protein BGW80DRAFT_1289588 [Lactifluus volemus]
MRSFIVFAFALVLAGQALALNIAIGGSVGNVTADQFLTLQDADLTSKCQQSCMPATTAIQSCNGNDGCLCNNATVTAITGCQQCYFTTLIQENRRSSDPKAGSTPALVAYAASCLASPANVTVPPTEVALTLPPGWIGPADEHLNLGATIVYVGVGAILGVGSLAIVCTM